MLIYKNKNLIVGALLVTLLFILKYPILNTPHFWDATLWIKSAYWTLNNNFNPVLPFPLENGGLDTGHPPLVFLSLALAFYLFGNSLITAHFVMLLFAVITIIFTYLLASYLYDEKVGIISSLFLLFSPLFFAQSGIVSLDLPLAAFTISTIYFALRNNIIGYLISGALLALSKEPGVLTIIAILVYIFIKNYKESKQELIKKCFIYSIPIIIFAIWIYYHAINQPIYNAISGSSEFWRPITPIIFFRFLNRLKFLFLENFHWVLTLIILITLSNTKKLIKITRKRLLISVLITLLLIYSFKA
ncbi:MAG: glycosyltransferase family 39 protein, partial [Candidatus Aenigmarchaeota archaeon]|nr:glycosyltransferase family 39 protein [Candidatus Aenigmarchaeota archaeon]